MDPNELKKLIGFHILYYTYSTEKLVNFRPEGDLATDEEKLVNAGQYFKHRTRAQEAPTVAQDTAGNYVTVYHQEKYLPVFSYLFFQTKDIDAKTNYEYFYPNSTWTGSNGFNVSNASVNTYEIMADNGYIYEIDAVLKPLNTLMGEMKQREDYSLFASLYDAHAEYKHDSGYSSSYGAALGVDSLFLYQHKNFPSIGLEWMYNSNTMFEYNAARGYSIFAPSNSVLSEFYEDFWKGYGYTSLEDVDKTLMSYVLGQYICHGMAFPEDFSNENVVDNYGNAIDINPYEIPSDARAMCTNGTFYGITQSQLPQYFSSVMGPAFKYKDRLAFMYALSYSGNMLTYGSTVSNYVMFIPDNETMQNSGFEIKVEKNENYLKYEPEGEWITISSTQA